MALNQKSFQTQKKYLDDLLKRRFFFAPSFDIYGGVAGLYDYGPAGCAIKNNLESFWREHFILEENMLEVSTTCLTPLRVLKASGHVDRFADLMVKDLVNGNVYRADKYLEEWIDIQMESKKVTQETKDKLASIKVHAGELKKDQISQVFREYQIKSRDNNNFSEPEEFNLMFPTSIGPTGNLPGFLRPETAQGIFVNFNKLLEYNNGKLPFAGACMGLGFRNEIAPRAGLIRVREFQMAEIEHFVDPQDKNHPSFKNYKDLKLPLYDKDAQEKMVQYKINQTAVKTDITLEQAVNSKLIDNETLAYFMCRTYLFLTEAGINPNNLRFRQHLSNEMAHYAKDCWDAEIETSHGWVECVGKYRLLKGHADRAAFDLCAHTKESKIQLQAARLIEPVLKTFTIIHLNKPLIGKTFKQEQRDIIEYLDNMTEEDKLTFKNEFQSNKQYTFNINGKPITLIEPMIQKFEEIKKNVQEEKFVPSVIEPSFGIGRILYAIFEHSFKMRDEKRTYLNLPPRIAPVKCSILTVQNMPDFGPFIEKLRKGLVKKGISCKVDDGNVSIGKRYARTDEIGIPFGITIDKDTLVQESVTLREINSTRQIRVPIQEVFQLVDELVSGQAQFLEIISSKKYPEFTTEEKE